MYKRTMQHNLIFACCLFYTVMFVCAGIVLTASFRGRPLEGRKLYVPKGYVGELCHIATLKVR